MSPDDSRHGTNAGYLAHRRAGQKPCSGCREARLRYEKRRRYEFDTGRPRLIDATGSKRRIQALVALGWTYPAIAEEMGTSADLVHKLLNRYEVIRRDIAEKIAETYEQMSMTLPPRETRQQKRDASYALTVARKRGWVPPLAWDDIDDPDERPAEPEKVDGRLSVAQVIEDAEWLADDGMNLTGVLFRLGIKRNTFRDQLRIKGREDLYWRLADREPDAENRRAARDAIKRRKESAA